MEIEFILNFFNKLYIKNTSILFFYLFSLSYLIFHKKKSFIKNPLFFIGRLIHVFVIILIITVVVNVFFPFDKKGKILNFLLIFILFLSYFLFSGGLKSIKNEFNLLTKKNIFNFSKKILFSYLLAIFFSIYFNYSIFKVNTPFSWGINVDLYAHTTFINRLQNEKYPFTECKSNLICLTKDILLGYPRGIHSFLAYLDSFLPANFINKTDYAFSLFGILTASIIFLFIEKSLIYIIFVLPLVFLPSYSLMLLRDHPNSALFQFSLFLFVYYLFDIFEKRKLYLEAVIFILLSFFSGWFIYWFSMSLSSLPLIFFSLFFVLIFVFKKIFFKNEYLNHKKLIIMLFLFFSFILLFLLNKNLFNQYLDFLYKTANGILMSAKNQHIVDVSGFNLKVNFRNFLGLDMFSYNYFDRYQKNLFLEKFVFLFWFALITIFIFNLKRKSIVAFLSLFYFGFFLLIERIFPYSYLQIRIYSYLVVFLLILLYFLDLSYLKKTKFLLLILLLISFFTSRWFWKLHFDNQVYARANAAKNISLDYMIPAFALKESSGNKKILSFHIQDFNRAFILFFPYKYPYVYAYDRWDGRLIKDQIIFEKYLDFNKRNLGIINFKNVDILVLPVNYSYPKNLFEIIQFDKNSILLKKKFNFINFPIFVDKKNISIKEIKEAIERYDKNAKFFLKIENSNNNCYFISTNQDELLKQIERLNEKAFYYIEFLWLIESDERIENVAYSCN